MTSLRSRLAAAVMTGALLLAPVASVHADPGLGSGEVVLTSTDGGKTYLQTAYGLTLTYAYTGKEEYEENRLKRYFDLSIAQDGKLITSYSYVEDLAAEYDLDDTEAARAVAAKNYKDWMGIDISRQMPVEIGDLLWRVKALRDAPGLNPTVVSPFSDLGGVAWAEGPVLLAQRAGLVKGRTDSAYDPAAKVTQMESVVLMVRLLGAEAEAKAAAGPGDDLPAAVPAWGSGYYRVALRRGILTPQDDFQPSLPADRGTVTVWITRTIGSKHVAAAPYSPFEDTADFRSGEDRAIPYAAQLMIVSGFPDGNFRPRNPVTRAEVAVLLVRSMRYVPDLQGSVAGAVQATEDGLIVVKRVPADNKDGVIFQRTPVRVAKGALVIVDGKPATLARVAENHDLHAALNEQGEAVVVVVSRNWYTAPTADLYNGAGARALESLAAVRLTAEAGKPLDLTAYQGPTVTVTEAALADQGRTVRLAWTLSDPGLSWYPTFLDAGSETFPMDAQPDGITYKAPDWTATADGWAGRSPVRAYFVYTSGSGDRVLVQVRLK